MVTSICLSSVQIFAGKSERGGGERHRGQGSGHVGPMFRPHRYEKTPGQHEAIRAQKTRYSVTLWQFSHWLPDGGGWVTGLFLTIVQISSEFVGGQCASWRLPPKAAVSAYRCHSWEHKKRRPWFCQSRRKVNMGVSIRLLYDGFFLLPPSSSYLLYIFEDYYFALYRIRRLDSHSICILQAVSITRLIVTVILFLILTKDTQGIDTYNYNPKANSQQKYKIIVLHKQDKQTLNNPKRNCCVSSKPMRFLPA